MKKGSYANGLGLGQGQGDEKRILMQGLQGNYI